MKSGTQNPRSLIMVRGTNDPSANDGDGVILAALGKADGTLTTSPPFETVTDVTNGAGNVTQTATLAAGGAGTRNVVTGFTISGSAVGVAQFPVATLGDGTTTFWNGVLGYFYDGGGGGPAGEPIIINCNFLCAENAAAVLTVPALDNSATSKTVLSIRGYRI